ncbi:hypothetical protein C2G38_2101729 [Gigaspora rosea]|uniref:Uncharacterized protein n=1 Tax=Gigaspora rosea TaxID=44941 RepID=A0A397UY30_9GLOM|nr:hypothetical protein C2G38_2101729 [Gigaspora rosea]
MDAQEIRVELEQQVYQDSDGSGWKINLNLSDDEDDNLMDLQELEKRLLGTSDQVISNHNESITRSPYQAWLETWDINELDFISKVDLDEDKFSDVISKVDLDEDKFSDFISKVDLDEDKFSDFISKVDLDEDNKLSGLQEMIIDGKKNMNGVEIEIRSTKNKLYNMLENNLNSNTNFAIPCEAKDEMNYKTFTEALGVFDYVLQAII